MEENKKLFLMNRDGFSLLSMGFTGQKALQWKLKYIKAFNLMEKELNSPEKNYGKSIKNCRYNNKKVCN